MTDGKREALHRYFVERREYHKGRAAVETGGRPAYHLRKAGIYRTRIDRLNHGGLTRNRKSVA